MCTEIKPKDRFKFNGLNFEIHSFTGHLVNVNSESGMVHFPKSVLQTTIIEWEIKNGVKMK